MVVPVDSVAFPYWLKAMFGAPTTTGSDPYEHVFDVGDTMPSEVMEMRFSDGSTVITYAKHNGVKVSNFSMSMGGDQELVATIGLEGASETLSGTAYDASPTSLTLTPWNNYPGGPDRRRQRHRRGHPDGPERKLRSLHRQLCHRIRHPQPDPRGPGASDRQHHDTV